MSEESKNPEVPAEGAFEFVEPEDGIVRTYANYHRFGWTGYDVRLLFGELIDVEQNRYLVEETAHITMSWLLAKQLMENLKSLVDKYEAENGPIEAKKVPVLDGR